MQSKDRVELISLAIRKLIDKEKKNKDASSQDDDQLLLSKLLSQLDSLEGDRVLKKPGGTTELKEATSAAAGDVEMCENAGQVGIEGAEISTEELVKELRHVKRQNFITHCLLSALIVLTATWQLSEVKLILKLRDGLNHPFRSVGSIFTGMFNRPGKNGKDAEENHQIEAPPPIPLKIPELPLPELDLNGERH